MNENRVVLSYGSRPSIFRRHLRLLVGIVSGLVIAATIYLKGPVAWKHAQVLYFQRGFRHYPLPTTQPVLVEHYPGAKSHSPGPALQSRLKFEPDWVALYGSDEPFLIGRRNHDLEQFWANAGVTPTLGIFQRFHVPLFVGELMCSDGARLLLVSFYSRWYRPQLKTQGLVFSIDVFLPATATHGVRPLWSKQFEVTESSDDDAETSETMLWMGHKTAHPAEFEIPFRFGRFNQAVVGKLSDDGGTVTFNIVVRPASSGPSTTQSQ